MAEQEQLDASELVQSLMGPAPSEVFSLKRRKADGSIEDHPVRVCFLSAEENMLCLQRAQTTAKKYGEDSSKYKDIYREAQATELVALSLCRIEPGELNGKQFWRKHFADSDHLRRGFSENEIALCLNMYELVKAKYSMIYDFNPNEVDMWASRLSDAMLGTHFLSRLDSSHWPALLTCLAHKVRDLSKSLGQPLPSLLDSLESSPESSDDSTGGSTSSPEASWTESEEEVPNDRLISSSEARAKVREIEEKAKGEGDPET